MINTTGCIIGTLIPESMVSCGCPNLVQVPGLLILILVVVAIKRQSIIIIIIQA